MFLYSTVSTLKPIVGIVVTTGNNKRHLLDVARSLKEFRFQGEKFVLVEHRKVFDQDENNATYLLQA